jgi:hypothetical protein
MSDRLSWAAIASELDGSAEIARLEQQLADAEAEVARLRSGIARHRDGVGSTDTSIDGDLWALLDDAP